MSRNEFPGTCYRCGKRVEAGDGHFEKNTGKGMQRGRWRLQHAACAIEFRGTDVGNVRPIGERPKRPSARKRRADRARWEGMT